MCYTILARTLLMDTFPDPDICCKYLDKCQVDLALFFMDSVKVSLEGVEPKPDSKLHPENSKGKGLPNLLQTTVSRNQVDLLEDCEHTNNQDIVH